MPEWRVHLHAADKVSKIIGLKDEQIDLFKIGGLLPDAPWCTLCGVDEHETKYYLHRYHHGYKVALPIPDYDKYLEGVKDRIMDGWKDSSLIKGYIFHLCIDAAYNASWNDVVDVIDEHKYVIHTYSGNELYKGSVDEFMALKMKDIESYGTTLPFEDIHLKDIEWPYYSVVEALCGQRVTMIPDIIKLANEEVNKEIGTRNIVFTDKQYAAMTDSGITIFKKLLG